MTFLRTTKILLAAALMAGGLAASAAAQDATAPAAPAAAGDAAPANQINVQFTGWVSSCSGQGRGAALDCSITEQAVLSNGQVLSSIVIRVPADTRTPVMLILTPLGLALAPGVRYRIDTNDAAQLPLQTCEAAGCYAGTPVSDALLDQMRRGGTLFLTVENTQGTAVTIQFPLTGFTAAYEGIQ